MASYQHTCAAVAYALEADVMSATAETYSTFTLPDDRDLEGDDTCVSTPEPPITDLCYVPPVEHGSISDTLAQAESAGTFLSEDDGSQLRP